jgi:hypothetical protein
MFCFNFFSFFLAYISQMNYNLLWRTINALVGIRSYVVIISVKRVMT